MLRISLLGVKTPAEMWDLAHQSESDASAAIFRSPSLPASQDLMG